MMICCGVVDGERDGRPRLVIVGGGDRRSLRAVAESADRMHSLGAALSRLGTRAVNGVRYACYYSSMQSMLVPIQLSYPVHHTHCRLARAPPQSLVRNPTPAVLSLRSNPAYHFSITSSAIQLPFIPLSGGKGTANPPTLLYKFLPTACASLTASTGAAALASTNAELVPPSAAAEETSGFAPDAEERAAICGSIVVRGSHSTPSVAALGVPPAAEEEAKDEGEKDEDLSLKMALGLALLRKPSSCQLPVEGRNRCSVQP